MPSTTDFDKLLKDNDIPIVGVSGSGPDCRIDFLPNATNDQRDRAYTLAKQFDWTEKILKTDAALLDAITALSQDEFNTLDKKLLLQLCKQFPQYAPFSLYK